MKTLKLISILAAWIFISAFANASVTTTTNINGVDQNLTWYSGSTATGYDLSSSGSSMSITNPGDGDAPWNHAVTVLSTPLTLSVGEKLTLSFNASNITKNGIDGQYNLAFSMALFNSNGYSASIMQDANNRPIKSPGFKATVNPGTSTGSSLMNLFKRDTSVQDNRQYLINGHQMPWGGSTGSNIGTSSSTGNPLTSTDTYHFEYTLALISVDRLEITVTMSGGNLGLSMLSMTYTETDTTYIASLMSIDTIAFGNWSHYNTTTPGNSNGGITSITLSNISLGVSQIPEPSTYAAILGAAFLAFALYRRRNRR